MALAAIYNIPGTVEEMSEWSFAHMAHHHDINRVIYQRFNIAVPEYVLDPVNPADMQSWLYQHQTMHQNQNLILSIAGNNLLEVDWQNRDELAAWVDLNASEHYQAAAILGVG